MKPFLLGGMIGAVCFFPFPARAETVVLKSGKTFEGEIKDKTEEYVTLQSDTGLYKIRFNQMDPDSKARILGETPQAPQETSGTSIEEMMNALPDDLSVEDVEARLESYRAYFSKVDDLLWRYRDIMFNSTKKINEAVQKKQYSQSGQAAEETRQNILSLKKHLAKLDPPPELKNYHGRVRDIFTNTIKSINAWAFRDQQTYYRYHRMALQSFVSSLQERKKLNEFAGMPASMIDQMDSTIQYFQGEIDKRYY